MPNESNPAAVEYSAPRVYLLGTVAEMTAFNKTAGSSDGWQQLTVQSD